VALTIPDVIAPARSDAVWIRARALRRRALVVTARDEVEADVDRANLRRDRIGVLVDGALVERIDDGDLRATRGCDVVRSWTFRPRSRKNSSVPTARQMWRSC
jgi:hypothetical protein